MKKKSSITTQPDWRAIVLSLFMQYILLDSAYQVYGGLSGILKDVRIVFVLVQLFSVWLQADTIRYAIQAWLYGYLESRSGDISGVM